jgi:hypothetical protein
MQLQNLLVHKKNTTLCVNGHIYRIADDLVIRDEKGNAVDVPQVDADRLLANKTAWRPVGAPKPDRSAYKGTMKLVTATGQIIPPPPPPETRVADATKPAMEVSATIAAVDQFEAQKRGEVAEPKDPPTPKGDEEWDDPKESYSLTWLRACAKAYKVKYHGKDKALLVEKIKAAMYE